jgi:hypothetical protein
MFYLKPMIKHLRALSSLAFLSCIYATCFSSTMVNAGEQRGTCEIADGYKFECITESTLAKLNSREGVLMKIRTFDNKREWRVFGSFSSFFYYDESSNWVQVKGNCVGRKGMNYLYDANGGLLLGYPDSCGG